MRLSPAAELAMRGATVLAERWGQGPVKLAEICKARNCKRDYLVKVLGDLSRAELVTPVRGKNGGYMLSRPPGEITLLEIIEAVEGEQHLNFCQHEPSQCERSETCKIQKVWKRLQTMFIKELSGMTLGDCVS